MRRLAFGAGVLLAACAPTGPEDALPAERLTIETQRIEKILPCPSGGHALALTPCGFFAANTPQLLTGPPPLVRLRLGAAIDELVAATTSAPSLELAAARWLEEAVELDFSPRYRAVAVEIDYVDEGTLSVRVVDLGIEAAGSRRVVQLASFSLEDGRRFSLSDLFRGEWPDLLQRAGREAAAARRVNWAQGPGFLANFAIAEHGLVFHFHAGELGPDPLDVVVPYHRLQPILAPDGPLGARLIPAPG